VNEYSRTIAYLYGLQRRGMKFGLSNIRALLTSVGNPQNAFPSIHVAGTNGKGSTCSFLASIFMEAGYRTGLYTSPHLVRFTERIRINGREIPEKRLVRYADSTRSVVESRRATFFEATTCIAFQYFADEGVDIAVIETGLGGRLDSTNVIIPLASIITNIALDHTRQLGSTLSAIAREKGGIIKRGVPVVIGSLDGAAERRIRSIARRERAPVIRAIDTVRMVPAPAGCVSFLAGQLRTGPVKLGLGGEHQILNAGLAVTCLSGLLRRKTFRSRFRHIRVRSIRDGLEKVRRNTRLGGRLAVAGRARRVILDVAHNPAGMRATISSLLQSRQRNLTAVFGVMRDKEMPAMLDEIGKLARVVFAVRPATPRAKSAESISRTARRLGISSVVAGSVAAGLRKALRRKGTILVTGSHYVVGEALEYLKKNA
jgi:dihydrofolate synthase/folylpolyglutamate synthase